MKQSISLPVASICLDDLRIASPCAMRWEDMAGDGRSRHCGACRLNVYDLSEMTREEASALILKHEGHLCVRLHKRADGTVITKNCPVGLRRVRHAVVRLCGSVAAVLALGVGTVAAMGERLRGRTVRVSQTEPYLTLTRLLRTPPTAVVPPPARMPVVLMGSICVPLTSGATGTGTTVATVQWSNDATLDALEGLRVPVAFDATRVDGVVAFLASAAWMEVEVDWVALNETGVAVDTPITLSLNDASVAETLDRVVDVLPPGVAWGVRSGTLVITTEERASGLRRRAARTERATAPMPWDTQPARDRSETPRIEGVGLGFIPPGSAGTSLPRGKGDVP